jgi:periplasmic copper chaperone A
VFLLMLKALLRLLPLLLVTRMSFGASPLAVVDAWARATPPGVTTAAVYVTIRNAGAADRLVSGASPAARQVTLHAEVEENGVQHMRPLAGIEVPANGSVELAPGRMHLMLVDIGAPLAPGTTITVTLHFENAGDVTLEVPVRDARAEPEHHHH